MTGRDIPEGAYALTFTGGAFWKLDGADLGAAAVRGQQAQAVAGVSDRSAEVIGFALAHPDGVRAAEVAATLGLDQAVARTYLNRARDAGRVARVGRGLFGPPYTPPVMSVTTGDGEPALITAGVMNGGDDKPSSPPLHNTHNTRTGGHGDRRQLPMCPQHVSPFGPLPDCPGCQALAAP